MVYESDVGRRQDHAGELASRKVRVPAGRPNRADASRRASVGHPGEGATLALTLDESGSMQGALPAVGNVVDKVPDVIAGMGGFFTAVTLDDQVESVCERDTAHTGILKQLGDTSIAVGMGAVVEVVRWSRREFHPFVKFFTHR
jgi:hypothetical protein